MWEIVAVVVSLSAALIFLAFFLLGERKRPPRDLDHLQQNTNVPNSGNLNVDEAAVHALRYLRENARAPTAYSNLAALKVFNTVSEPPPKSTTLPSTPPTWAVVVWGDRAVDVQHTVDHLSTELPVHVFGPASKDPGSTWKPFTHLAAALAQVDADRVWLLRGPVQPSTPMVARDDLLTSDAAVHFWRAPVDLDKTAPIFTHNVDTWCPTSHVCVADLRRTAPVQTLLVQHNSPTLLKLAPFADPFLLWFATVHNLRVPYRHDPRTPTNLVREDDGHYHNTAIVYPETATCPLHVPPETPTHKLSVLPFSSVYYHNFIPYSPGTIIQPIGDEDWELA